MDQAAFSCSVAAFQGPHYPWEGQKPYFQRQIWWGAFSSGLHNHFSIERKYSTFLLSFFFLENILWTEEFSVAGQTMSLIAYFIWQQKAFKTSFDFDPLSDALTCNWLCQYTKLTKTERAAHFLHAAYSWGGCILLTIVHRCVLRLAMLLWLKLAGYLSMYFTLETLFWVMPLLFNK